MNHDTPLSFRRPDGPAEAAPCRVMTTAQLRALGVPAAETAERCRPGGPWQHLLPGVHLLRPGPPTGPDRLRAALLYATRGAWPDPGSGVPAQPTARKPCRPPRCAAMITGLAALALHGFAAVPPLPTLRTIDVLVGRLRRPRSAGWVRIRRTAALPEPVTILGVPVAPVPRAVADAVGRLTDVTAVRRLLTEAVRDGHCEPAALVRELSAARLLDRPPLVGAAEALLAEGRALAEDRLYRMVRVHGLPEPVWNVELRLPGGPALGGADAYWPERAVAVELDACAGRPGEAGAAGERHTRRRELLQRLGVTVVPLSPRALRDAPRQQATVVRTALRAAAVREPAAPVVVLPR
ncbi:hypothetical protein M3765_19155 [Streptomyces thermoviolaceus]|uniref:DUF559 domain-containing protein n=1 Tax=Streptomyces thermoviolaceus subsp. thermoviolaceus TaxID=66860 RepID=A0ABX0YVK4_STRTL|nr:hypothetical protein [Streptomyces thermoviolaceus]MCM3266096.1 hypothetical protein [Streptomyces thermoviolaceus]NJP16677.1 hypothetical protein [Streptomyces thermoviolaceus subsp. thermoviolaceus]GHB10377.1 hypothetical protein GCM10010512_47330 [Streptomyces thermoviolaceus subsp. thermoviolaceus]